MQYVCPVCGFVYDEEKEGVPFSALPAHWQCPWCGASKSSFAPKENKSEPPQIREPVTLSEDMTELTPMELSVIFSNLARGCEKQYLPRAQELYEEISRYFAAVPPAEPDARLETLSALIGNNLQGEYAALRQTADEAGDRGTARICVWGEKVTRILQALLERYQREGEEMLSHTGVWVCSVCGFVSIGDEPPKQCPVCKVPAWKFTAVEGRQSK